MELTTMFGRILSTFLIVYGIGLLTSRKFYTDLLNNAEESDSIAVTLGGVINFFIGISILVNHWVWDSFLAVIVSILALCFLLKGIAYIILPNSMLRAANSATNRTTVYAIIYLIVGLVTAYLSFFA